MKKLVIVLLGVMLAGSFAVCSAGDDIILPSSDLEKPCVEYIFTDAITIREGWNLIAMPVLPIAPYTIEQFIADVESYNLSKPGDPIFHEKTATGDDIIIKPLADWNIPVVAVYKNGQFEKYPKEGVTYNMVPGEAYFVYAKYIGPREGTAPYYPSKTIRVAGKRLDIPVSLNLARGWNGLAVFQPLNILSGDLSSESITARRLYTLSELSKELDKQNIKAKRIAFWSADKQEWEQYALPYVIDMTDPVIIKVINPAEGFFLLCDENGLFIPMMPKVTPPNDGPNPPIPPPGIVVEPVVTLTGEVKKAVEPPVVPNAKYLISVKNEWGDYEITPLVAADDKVDKKLAEISGDGFLHAVRGVEKEYGRTQGDLSWIVKYILVQAVDPVFVKR